jgi:flagellar biosynthesis protein FlhG
MTENKQLIPSKRPRKRAQIVTVAGGKGGIGKTFFSVNFGVELKSRGFRVLIFDGDINLSNVNLLLNIDETRNFRDYLQGNIGIGEVIQKGVGGVDALYVGDELNSILSLNDQDYSALNEGLMKLEESYDYIVIDSQAGLTELNQRLLLMSDRAILITNPEITALVDLYKVIKVAATAKSGIQFEILVNRVLNVEHAARVYDKISKTVSEFGIRTSLSFLGFIVDDPKRVVESIQKRIPIVVLHQTGNISECFRMISESFLRHSRPKRKFPFFYGLLER